MPNTPKTTEEMWDALEEQGVHEDVLKAVSNINGYSTETMESILYWATGYRSFDQLEDEEEGGDE